MHTRFFYLLIIGLTCSYITACSGGFPKTPEGEHLIISPAKPLEFPAYHTVLIRYNGIIEAQKALVKNKKINLGISPATQAKKAFLQSFLAYPQESVKNYIFLDAKNIGLQNTYTNLKQTGMEGIVKSGEVKLTKYGADRLTALDINGVFVVDIKKITIEANHKRKVGRFITIYTGPGALAGVFLWLFRDFELSVSLEFSYLTKNNNSGWQTKDLYDKFAGNKRMKSMPHGSDFVKIKKKEVMDEKKIKSKLDEVLKIYSKLAVKTFFGKDNDIPYFRTGKSGKSVKAKAGEKSKKSKKK